MCLLTTARCSMLHRYVPFLSHKLVNRVKGNNQIDHNDETKHICLLWRARARSHTHQQKCARLFGHLFTLFQWFSAFCFEHFQYKHTIKENKTRTNGENSDAITNPYATFRGFSSDLCASINLILSLNCWCAVFDPYVCCC